ncbi:2OG-Fe dioxygenase family protein [Lysobacter sp. TAF61]|uniref:2OG-Fe dioxygenase family protein n=1 Tax=Lysobacter sp. TAF61 TaxID=3233072 RepID=UPI003F945DF1
MQTTRNTLSALQETLRRDGFGFVAGGVMRGFFQQRDALDDWAQFAASWDDLAPDAYLAAVGHHRSRRYAVFAAGSTGRIVPQPHQPHYQSRDYNNLQGGIERWFEPVLPEVVASSSLRAIVEFCRDFYGELSPEVAAWHIELHQFRIEARPGEPGQPTPEGVHRDGVNYVLVLLIDRHNIVSGKTTIHAADGRELGSFTLTHPMDAALVDDSRVFHGVTAVEAQDPQEPSHRDVLVVTLRAVG